MTYAFEQSGKVKNLTPEQLAAADEHSTVIVLNTGTLPNGTHYWAYVAITPSRYSQFLQAVTMREPIYLEEYGAIIKSGLNSHVPDEVRQEMAREYGCNEDYLERLTEEVGKAQTAFLTQQETQRINDLVATMKQQND